MVCAEVVKVSSRMLSRIEGAVRTYVEGQRGACDVNQEFDDSGEDESKGVAIKCFTAMICNADGLKMRPKKELLNQ